MVHSAVIAPTRADGQTWDDDIRIPQALTHFVARYLVNSGEMDAMAAGLVAYYGSEAVNELGSITSRPDPKGSLDLMLDGRPIAHRNLATQNNAFTPTWISLGFRGVNWSESPSLKLVLIDNDDLQDDPIGTVVISTRDLEQALAEGGHHHFVSVADQSRNQLVFVEVSVIAENWTYAAPKQVDRKVDDTSNPPPSPEEERSVRHGAVPLLCTTGDDDQRECFTDELLCPQCEQRESGACFGAARTLSKERTVRCAASIKTCEERRSAVTLDPDFTNVSESCWIYRVSRDTPMNDNTEDSTRP